MKKMAWLLAMVMMISAFSGCASAPPAADSEAEETPAAPSESATEEPAEAQDDEPITFTFWINDGSSQWMDVWNTTRDNYKEVAPNVTIETFGIPWDTATTKFNTASATGTLPDMAHVAPQIAASMLALDELVDGTQYYESYEFKDDLNSTQVEYCKALDPKKPGLWLFPMFGSVHQIWYRSDWFAEESLEFPQTWDGLLEAAETITGDGRYGWSFRGGPGGYHILLGFIMSYTDNPHLFLDDGKGASIFNEPAALDALNKYIALYIDGNSPATGVTNGYTEMIAEISNGNAGMAWHHLQSASLLLEKLTEEQVGYGWFPVNENGRRFKPDDAQGVVLFQACPEENRDAAFDYIEFLWTPEQQKEIITRAGGVPTNLKTDVGDDPYIQAAMEQSADPATMLISLPTYLPGFNEYCNEVIVADLQALILQDMAPEEAAAKWAADFDAMNQEYWA